MTMNVHNASTTHATAPLSSVGGATGNPAASSVTPATSLLPEPSPALMLGADMGAEIAALAVKSGQTQRDIDTKATETQDSIADRAAAASVNTMHDEASTMRAGAWESGLLQIGAGAFSIASAGESIGAQPGTEAAGIAGGLKGISEGLSGGSTLAGGLNKAAETDSEALATASKALSDAAQRSGAALRDGQKGASDFIQSAIDFYREYQSTKAEAQAAALHRA
jgi:hypothetical protein